jgi:thioredoxin 1
MNVEVLKFSAQWCPPCRVLAQTLNDVEGITSVDIDKDMETARLHNVRSVPTLVFKKDGVEVHRISGAISLDNYNQILDDIKFSKEL